MGGALSDGVIVTLIGLVLANITGVAAWFFKRQDSRLSSLEKEMPAKAGLDVFNATVKELRERNDSNTDKLLSQIREMERELSARQQELILALTGRGKDN